MEDFDFTMNINVKAVICLTKKCLSELIKHKGSIVNVSSVVSTQVFPNLMAYCMSKAALDMFTKSLSLEVAGRQVRVNSVNPGTIKTKILKSFGEEKIEEVNCS